MPPLQSILMFDQRAPSVRQSIIRRKRVSQIHFGCKISTPIKSSDL